MLGIALCASLVALPNRERLGRADVRIKIHGSELRAADTQLDGVSRPSHPGVRVNQQVQQTPVAWVQPEHRFVRGRSSRKVPRKVRERARNEIPLSFGRVR